MFASGPLVHYAVDGHSDHIVGVNKKAKAMYEGSFYAQLIPEFLKLNMNVAGEGFAPNVEAILEIKPDVVLQWVFDPKIIEPLERRRPQGDRLGLLHQPASPRLPAR